MEQALSVKNSPRATNGREGAVLFPFILSFENIRQYNAQGVEKNEKRPGKQLAVT